MRKGLLLCFLSTALLALGPQVRGHGRPAATPGSGHSNAPLGTPAASSDRDKGTDRAEDVGKGKKKGLKKRRQKDQKRNR